MNAPDPLAFFRLKPIQAARVSEISETTAAAPVTDEERVNFHIGNPLQDARLSSAFLRVALGIDFNRQDLHDAAPQVLLEHLGWEAADQPVLEFIIRTIQKSTPYSPRGGYARKAPHALLQTFSAWLAQQQEPLQYDLGEKSGRREVILASGGIGETLRVILRALSDYLQVTPVRLLCYHQDVTLFEGSFPNLKIVPLADNERRACQEVEECLAHAPGIPTFLVIGSLLGEETRRRWHLLSMHAPLFFIEANNAPNHLSLAREARLVQRVIRLLTPAIFAARLDPLATVFVVGNADFLNVIENVHFKLKGTPSASEVEFLSFLLEQNLAELTPAASVEVNQKPVLEGLGSGSHAAATLFELSTRVSEHLAQIANDGAPLVEHALQTLELQTSQVSRIVKTRWKEGWVDEFAGLDNRQVLKELIEHAHEPAWRQALERNFMSVFTRHQPQYLPAACQVASGSSRTALGLLGFHCGISEVVIPDLSWSYEQCFPRVHAVPLTETLALDVAGMIAKIAQLCRQDMHWPEYGAVAINNPHNATGRIFAEDALRALIAYCLEHQIYVIDDLAYQNVAPMNGLPEIKTVRQIADELVRFGIVDVARLDRLITVHSMSKTDCLAGARLAVVEILDESLRQRFQTFNAQIQPNLAALLICYLFYRGPQQAARAYWSLRNALFQERSQAILSAADHLPPDRNPFGLMITPPAGSMYPLLRIEHLPAGLSLDWLASSLARRGIGLLPLATFARTERGFDTGRSTFRLTLGGSDRADTLLAKTRRLLIDLNRMIAEEDARYNRKQLPLHHSAGALKQASDRLPQWEGVARQIFQQFEDERAFNSLTNLPHLDGKGLRADFLNTYLPERLEVFRTRLLNRASLSDELLRRARQAGGDWLTERLQREFMKDALSRRQQEFRLRSYDRTVHPTQRYSLHAEMACDSILDELIAHRQVPSGAVKRAAQEILQEYLGRNVSINSQLEADEILLDFDALTAGELYTELFTDVSFAPLLSFWSDWDGSNRPSGQGHRLVAALVMENVRRMASILNLLHQVDPHLDIQPDLLNELAALPQRSRRFIQLLDKITLLTHQLEQRYRGILPFSVDATSFQRFTTRLHLRRDPARVLWQHNDRYERSMLDLRRQRRSMLETYFALNKQLRKQLFALIPAIQEQRSVEPLLRAVVGYRDLLQRTVITPRIHQGMITARDSFAIDTTVYNLQELNVIAGKYGNPGMALGLQISLSTQPEALIALDRKMGIQAGQARRENPSVELPSIWLIPLFEYIEAVDNLPAYLERIWEYATQSRHTEQTPQSRFSEIMAEIFIAGSDMSQQIGQAHGAFQYLKAKYRLQLWLAEHGVAETVRIKLGSGEPMQRQGGYYSQVAGQPAFLPSGNHHRRLAAYLPAAAQQSTAYAITPLQGVFLGGDLRTFQSCLSEQLRYLPVGEYANLLYHVREAQQIHRQSLVRAAETITESRLGAQSRSLQELERLTVGVDDALYTGFLEEATDHFRHILYGRPEDVVGIHIISYFIGRSIPQLRDRPTSRHRLPGGMERGQQILANIVEIIPLAKQGSLLRAIAHNQAQTGILGINQLTTGLFRALDYYAQKTFPEAERQRMMAERILPNLPVYEILHTLRLYQDAPGELIRRIETAFPAGNSAFVALREDGDARQRFLPLFQQELLRRHGLNVGDFFAGEMFIPQLLPTLRPDLAVLLQKDLFNTDPQPLIKYAHGAEDAVWRDQVTQLLQIPVKIRYWRMLIWDVIGASLYQRVHSFTELATALYSLPGGSSVSSGRSFGAPQTARLPRLSSALSGFIRTARVDDEMRQFLVGAVEYLNSYTEDSIEIPVSIIRALNDVEQIALIEESALPEKSQEVLRCAVLQIARLAGENG